MPANPLPDEPMGMPSPEALKLATDVVRRRYVLPETMDHPAVRSECMRLAYLIMAYDLVPHSPGKADQSRKARPRPAAKPRAEPELLLVA
jgi:hypothetical protein